LEMVPIEDESYSAAHLCLSPRGPREVPEDRQAGIAPANDVIAGAWKFDAQRSRHDLESRLFRCKLFMVAMVDEEVRTPRRRKLPV
jgi:hypothetical protein